MDLLGSHPPLLHQQPHACEMIQLHVQLGAFEADTAAEIAAPLEDFEALLLENLAMSPMVEEKGLACT